MIFGDYFDRSLWLMLQGNKKGRDILMNFVNTLTDEMYEKIYSLIAEHYSDPSIISSYSELSGDVYDFAVKYRGNYLTMVLKKYIDGKKEKLDESYEVSLFLIYDYLIECNSVNKVKIGSVNYMKKREKGTDDSSLKKIMIYRTNYEYSYDFKRHVLDTDDLIGIRLFSSRRIELKNVPVDIYSSYFINKNKEKNSLVRKKKK